MVHAKDSDNGPISIDGQSGTLFDQYKYLGSMKNVSDYIDHNIQHRIG